MIYVYNAFLLLILFMKIIKLGHVKVMAAQLEIGIIALFVITIIINALNACQDINY